MNKRSLFMIILVLLVVLIFSIAAACNGCGKKVTIDLSGMGAAGSTEQDSDNQESNTGSSDDTTSDSQNDSSSQEAPQEADDQESDPPQDNDDEKELSEPTIELSIYKDATYSPEDDVCFYRVKATVTGNPRPDIKWSKDDSHSSFGDDITQVNLKRGETYTLTATAINSEGSKTASIELVWDCK